MATLYDLVEDFKLLNGDYEESTDAVVEFYLNDLRDANHAEVQGKVANYIGLIRNFESDAEAIKVEVERLTHNKQVVENKAKRLKQRLLDFFLDVGWTTVSTPRGTVTVSNNGGAIPLVVDLEDEIPDDFAVVKRELDTKKVREFLASGGELEWAKLGERGKHLRIK